MEVGALASRRYRRGSALAGDSGNRHAPILLLPAKKGKGSAAGASAITPANPAA